MVWRACATASLVTAHVLTMPASRRPAALASTRIVSDSARLRRQPKVTNSTGMSDGCGDLCRFEHAFIFQHRGAGHQHVTVALAPYDGEIAAGQTHLHDTIGALEPRRRNCRGAGCRTAGLGQARATLPCAHDDMIAVHDMGQRDIGALGKDRMIFQKRPEPFENVSTD